ncbi:MAG: hypothetical protein FWF12_08275, partial [Betaproteobacteria bacterium]|nr:hypothetical protein [Betaproteobacteria bacterium]
MPAPLPDATPHGIARLPSFAKNPNRMLKKSEALEKPMSTRPKMTENYLVKLLFGLILTRFVDS